MDALLDSNVLIAIIEASHIHNEPSADLMLLAGPAFAVASHSFAEAYNTLTRSSGPYRFPPEEALAAIEALARKTILLGLTASQTVDSIRAFAKRRGIGPRLYDYLIGQVARLHAVPVLITWNTGHMRTLLPDLDVLTPRDFLRRHRR